MSDWEDFFGPDAEPPIVYETEDKPVVVDTFESLYIERHRLRQENERLRKMCEWLAEELRQCDYCPPDEFYQCPHRLCVSNKACILAAAEEAVKP